MRGKKTSKVFFNKIVYYGYEDKDHPIYRDKFSQVLGEWNSTVQVGKNMFTWKRADNELALFVGFNMQTRDKKDLEEFLEKRGILYNQLHMSAGLNGVSRLDKLLDIKEKKVDVWDIVSSMRDEGRHWKITQLKVPISKVGRYYKTKNAAEKAIIEKYETEKRNHKANIENKKERIKRIQKEAKEYERIIRVSNERIEYYTKEQGKFKTMRNRLTDLKQRRKELNEEQTNND